METPPTCVGNAVRQRRAVQCSAEMTPASTLLRLFEPHNGTPGLAQTGHSLTLQLADDCRASPDGAHVVVVVRTFSTGSRRAPRAARRPAGDPRAPGASRPTRTPTRSTRT